MHVPCPGRRRGELPHIARASLDHAAPTRVRDRRTVARIPQARGADLCRGLQLGRRRLRPGSRASRRAGYLGADGAAPRGPRWSAQVGVPALSAADLRVVTAKPRGIAELEDLDAVFSALAHRSRRTILSILEARGGEMTSG